MFSGTHGRAPVYTIVEGGEIGSREEHVKQYLNENPEEWVVLRDELVYGFCTVEVVNATGFGTWVVVATGSKTTFGWVTKTCKVDTTIQKVV